MATSGTVAVIGGGVGKVLGLALHNDGCIWSTPIHKKKDGWRHSSPWKRAHGGGVTSTSDGSGDGMGVWWF
jgi:hypothetical protein